MFTGIIATISDGQLDGTITQDSDGSSIVWKDKSFPSKGISLGDRVTYNIGEGLVPAAKDLELVAPGPVQDGGTIDGATVTPGTSLTLTGGTIVNGNLLNSGGQLIITGGSTVNGRISSGDGGALIINGATVTGKTIVDENATVDIDNTTFQRNVNISDTPAVRIGGGTDVSGGNLRITGASSTSVSGTEVDGGNLVIDTGGQVIIAAAGGRNTCVNGGNLRITGSGDISVGDTQVDNGNLRVSNSSSIDVSSTDVNGGNLVVEDTPIVGINGSTLTNNATDKNRRIRISSANTVTLANNTLNQAVIKTENCDSVTATNNNFNQTNPAKNIRLRLEETTNSVNITGGNMGMNNVRVVNNLDESPGFTNTCAVSISGVQDASRVRADYCSSINISSVTTTLNSDSSNNTNVVCIDSGASSVSKSTIAGRLRFIRCAGVTAKTVTVDGDIEVKESSDVSITGSTSNGDLILTENTGSCTQSGNTIAGNTDDCPTP